VRGSSQAASASSAAPSQNNRFNIRLVPTLAL
jgi:hypothetical protein